jgi:hypothetical protein
VSIVIAILFVILAGLYAWWVFKQVPKSSCPNCAMQSGEQSLMIPVFGNLLWFCPSCLKFQQSRLLASATKLVMSEEKTRDRLKQRLRPGHSDDEATPPERESSEQPPSFGR